MVELHMLSTHAINTATSHTCYVCLANNKKRPFHCIISIQTVRFVTISASRIAFVSGIMAVSVIGVIQIDHRKLMRLSL